MDSKIDWAKDAKLTGDENDGVSETANNVFFTIVSPSQLETIFKDIEKLLLSVSLVELDKILAELNQVNFLT